MEAATVIPINADAMEAEVLGAMMLSGQAIDSVLGGTALRAEHFWRARHREVFTAIVALSDQGKPVTPLTVVDVLGRTGKLEAVGGADVVHALLANSGAPSRAGHYAERIVEKWSWRERSKAIPVLADACEREDPDALAEAEDLLRSEAGRRDTVLDSAAQAELVWQMVEDDQAPVLSWPFRRLTDACPIEKGSLNVVSAYSNTGKSHFVDAMLDRWHQANFNVGLLFNEGTEKKRVLRRVARHTDVPIANVRKGRLQGNDHELLLREMNRDSWPMIKVHGQHWRSICNQIRRHRFDACVVDLINRVPRSESVGINDHYETMVNAFADAAEQADCAVVLVAQPNRGTAQGITAYRRKPAMSDLYGSSAIENAADIVTFIYRPRDDEGEMDLEGEIYHDKTRDGELALVKVEFKPRKLRFELR